MSGFSLAALKNTLDEVRVQVYAKNETEKKVGTNPPSWVFEKLVS